MLNAILSFTTCKLDCFETAVLATSLASFVTKPIPGGCSRHGDATIEDGLFENN